MNSEVVFNDIYYKVAHAFEAGSQFVRTIQQRYVPYFKNCKKVLDIGCGQGIFLKMLLDAGCEPEGVDRDPEMVFLASQKGIKIYQEDAISFIETTSNQYDGIFASHIIEHLQGQEALQFVKSCSDHLVSGGILVIVTPNFRNPVVSQENFWLDITHIRPYPIPLITKILETLEFTGIEAGLNAGDLDAFVAARKP